MIKENEVRINNYYNGGIELVGSLRAKLNANEHNDFRLTRGHFEVLCGYTDWLKFINPIPLTEEWLEKLGFIEEKRVAYSSGEAEEYFIYYKNSILFNGIQNCWYYNKIKIIDIKHVHQLQNIFFILTGEELTHTIK